MASVRNLYRDNVYRLPVEALWDSAGRFGSRTGDLTKAETANFLENKTLLVVAAMESPLKWIEKSAIPDFWNEVHENIPNDPDEGVDLAAFPNSVAYSPSLWCGRAGEQIILLEQYH